MIARLLIGSLLAFAPVTYSAAAESELQIAPTPAAELHYAWISFLTEGPAGWFSDGKVRGRYLRLVVYGQVEEMPSTFRIETIAYGDEGCCRRLVRARRFDIAQSMEGTFGPLKTSAAEFQFVRWISPRSLEFRYRGERFMFQDLDGNTIRVKRAPDR